MSKSEFLDQLRAALQEDLSSAQVQENVDYYNQYISEETKKGKSEKEVLDMLGDPWILARTIIDACDGTDRNVVYEAEDREGSSSSDSYSRQPHIRVFGIDTWWKKLLVILAVVMVLLFIVTVITGVARLFAPILIPLLVITIICRLFSGGRRS